jgi:transketolase
MELRQAFSNGLVDLAKLHKEVMLVESDVECPARKWFETERPKQYVNTGIAEQNAASICGGLSSQGFVPYWYLFGFLVGRAYDQIRQSIAVDKRNVKIFGYNCCVSGLGGRSHNCVDDIGLMRLIPDMTIVAPADEYELYKAVMTSYNRKGSVYVRFGRGSVPIVTNQDDDFRIGKGRVMQEGNFLTVVAYGSMVDVALKATEGLDVKVINMSTIKPLDKKVLEEECVTRDVVVLEEAYLNGGLGECICREMPELNVSCIGVKDVWMQSGKGDLRSHYGLDVEGVRRRLKKLCC